MAFRVRTEVAVRSQPSSLEMSHDVPTTERKEFDDEYIGLRYRLIRLRLALRYASQPRVETILREVIEHIERRLEQLGR
jgi:hypothetical protein